MKSHGQNKVVMYANPRRPMPQEQPMFLRRSNPCPSSARRSMFDVTALASPPIVRRWAAPICEINRDKSAQEQQTGHAKYHAGRGPETEALAVGKDSDT